MITRTTYRRPLPGSPLFFHLPSPAPKKQNSTALKAVPPLLVQNCRPISSHFSASIFPLFQTLYLYFYSCPLPPCTWDEFGYLSHAISVLEARGDKGVRVKERVWSFPLCPLGWMAAQDSETDSVRSVDVFPSPYSLVTATALATRSKKEERMRSPSEIGYMKMLARLRHLH